MTTALKEWDFLISALLQGRQALLLRKGGILESENQFELEHPRFLFYPTFIHQDPLHLKPELRQNLPHERTEPEKITLRGHAEVAEILEVPSRAQLEQLDDLHIWSPAMLDMRFNYRPEKPLYLVIVRAFTLPKPIEIQNKMEYVGCKSWVTLSEQIDLANSAPAMTDDALTKLTERVRDTFRNSA